MTVHNNLFYKEMKALIIEDKKQTKFLDNFGKIATSNEDILNNINK